MCSSLRVFLRFLDHVDPDADTHLLPEFLLDEMGHVLQGWLESRKLGNYYAQVRGLVSKMRRDERDVPLHWPSASQKKNEMKRDLAQAAADELYDALKDEAKDVQRRLGAVASLGGQDPCDIVTMQAPRFEDLAVFLWLFLLKTGWNLGTAMNLNVSSDEAWFRIDHADPRRRTLHAFKGRSDDLQFATSLEKASFRPFKVIEFMIGATSGLRAILQGQLIEVRRRAITDTESELRKTVAELEEAVNSPWLYYVEKRGQLEIKCMRHEDRARVNHFIRQFSKRHKLAHDDLKLWSTRNSRDVWIRDAYERSAFDVIMAQASAQHKRVVCPHWVIRAGC